MTTPKANKERINITVDPTIHQQFSQFAERNNQSVSGILNEVMTIYCGDPSVIDSFSPVARRLRSALLEEDRRTFQGIVRKRALEAGLKEVSIDDTDPLNPIEIPPESRTDWVGTIGKSKVGVKLAHNLAQQPDITLGQALLFRGTFQCERVILVVPYTLGVPPGVLTATTQAGLEVVGVDLLDAVLRSRSRRESPAEAGAEATPTEGQKRLRNARSELERMQAKRKEREGGTRPSKPAKVS